jgi:pSer/pThr/pTyr-binding forkhead associated (FHA) protein
MDDLTALERGHELQRPHRDFGPALPADFVPLRLVLQPAGPCIELTRPSALLGRHSGADIRLGAADVSRRHCLLLFDDGHWKILDLSSLNGVFVNDERMHEATLYDGDRVRIGHATFTVQLKRRRGEAKRRERVADVLPRPETERRAS